MDDKTDIVHLFATERLRLASALRSTLRLMKPDAAIWVSWPKKAAKVRTDITEDTIGQVALPMRQRGPHVYNVFGSRRRSQRRGAPGDRVAEILK